MPLSAPLAALLVLPAIMEAAISYPSIDRYTGLTNCKPGHLVWVNCNLCTCSRIGRPNPVCARMWCQPVPSLNALPSEFNNMMR